MDNPESSVQELIHGDDKSKWIADSSHDMKLFTEIELKRITSNYKTVIGRGGFGEVFQGVLEDGSMVAVKRLIRSVDQNFEKELKVHREMNHKNVVRLIGCCIEEHAFTIVTEYIPKGNLSDALHKDNIPIPLDTRLTIAIECAEALGYMHSQMDTRVIHGDIKPANILLDDRLGVKVSDFGISRLVNTEDTLYTVNVVGSIDYMDPLFRMYGRLSATNDVYSFGVVLLELITRKKPRTGHGEMSLVAIFTEALAKGARRVRELFDPEIATSSEVKIAEEIVKLASKCLKREHKKRPEMLEVAERLRKLREVPQQRQGLFSRSPRGKKQQTPAQTSAGPSRLSSTGLSGSTVSPSMSLTGGEPPEDCKVPTPRQWLFSRSPRGKKQQTPAQTFAGPSQLSSTGLSGSTVASSMSLTGGEPPEEDCKVPTQRQGLFFSSPRRGKKQQTPAETSAGPSRQSSTGWSGSTASSTLSLTGGEPPEEDCKVPTQRQGLFPWFRRGKNQQTTPAQTCTGPSRQSSTTWHVSALYCSLPGCEPPEDALLDESAQVLGKGTVGTTYKVTLGDGSAIAIKRLDGVDHLTKAEFEQRMAAIGAAEECVNVLPMLGYHFAEEEKFVSYLCMPMGSLAKALHGDVASSHRETMDWYQRLCILSNVVDALESIHSLGPSSCHGNIKSSNVLLEESHAARVSENGLATLGLQSPKAGCGYRAPEVTDPRLVSQKADVYSLGVLMLELFTRKAPVDKEGVDLLLRLVISSAAREKLVTQVLDTELIFPDEEIEHMILQLLQLAVGCCSHNANLRPSMSNVRELLQYLLQKTMLYAV